MCTLKNEAKVYNATPGERQASKQSTTGDGEEGELNTNNNF